METIDLGRSLLLAAFREFHAEVLRCRQIVQANPWGVTGRDFGAGADGGEPGPGAAAALGLRLRTLLERHAREAVALRPAVEPRLFQEAQYVMAALADETFLGVEWAGREAWLDNLLEDQLFHTRRAGERFFEGVQRFRLRERDLAGRELAAVYLMALALGFEGRYRGTPGAAELEEHRRHLFEFVYGRPPAPRSGGRHLFPRAYAHTVQTPPAPAPLSGRMSRARAVAFPPVWLAPVLPYVPYLLVALGVLGLVAGGLLLRRWVQALRRPAVPAPPAPPPPVLERLRRSFEAGARALAGQLPKPAARERMPRFALLGEVGAGKSSVAAGLPLPRVFSPTPPPADASALCRWWYFHHGVVIDVSGEGEEHVWSVFVRLAQRLRPHRGLDGIVLVVPCTELTGLAPDALLARGEAAFRRLHEAESVLGDPLPVYLLVTRTDRLEGFRALVDALAPGQRAEIFGWSSPFSLDDPFDTAWIDVALATMEAELLEAGLELLTEPAPTSEAERILHLPGELRSLAEPMRVYLGAAFRRSAYRRECRLRGIYFTGDARADAVGGPAGRDLVFLEHLFEHKVFAESATAAPAALPFPRGLHEAEGRAPHLHATGSPS